MPAVLKLSVLTSSCVFFHLDGGFFGGGVVLTKPSKEIENDIALL